MKNKLAPPFRKAEFEILYGIGVNRMGELVDAAEKHARRDVAPAARVAPASSARRGLSTRLILVGHQS